jgi:TolB protein
MTPGSADRLQLFPIASAGGIRGGVGRARWSPDGKAIAFEAAIDSVCAGLPCIREQLWIVNSDGSGRRKLTGGRRPAWAPDGRTIVFGNDHGIATIAPDGGGLEQFTIPLPAQPEEAAWSPDGSRLAFTTYTSSSGTNAIFSINRDGTGLVRLTPAGGSDLGPKWSPDGSRIAFRMDFSGPSENSSGLGVMNADGSARRNIADVELEDLDFTWSPDGGRLALTISIEFEIGDDDVYLVNVDGSGRSRIATSQHSDSEPSWAVR